MVGNMRGVSAEQDARFKNKEKALLKKMNFPPEFSTKVDLSKVQWAAMKPWIAKRLTELLGGLEDDVLIAYVYGQLEDQKEVDPRMMQINLTGFLEKNASLFCKELWTLLISASNNPSGIPQQFLDEKAAEIRQREAERQRIQERIQAERRRQEERNEERHRDRDTTRDSRDNRERNNNSRRGRSRSRDREHRRHRSRSRSRDRTARRKSRSRSRSKERTRRYRDKSGSRERPRHTSKSDNKGERRRRSKSRSVSRSPRDKR